MCQYIFKRQFQMRPHLNGSLKNCYKREKIDISYEFIENIRTVSNTCVILQYGLVIRGRTRATARPLCTTRNFLSNIRWNGKTRQNVAGLTFGSANTNKMSIFSERFNSRANLQRYRKNLFERFDLNEKQDRRTQSDRLFINEPTVLLIVSLTECKFVQESRVCRGRTRSSNEPSANIWNDH